MSDAHVVTPGEGQTFDLGIIQMRLLAPKQLTSGQFSLVEFRGGEGPWTIPHIHRQTIESFFVVEGTFMFTVGGRDIEVGPGAYLLVPPGTPHAMRAREGGGRFLTVMAPAGLEAMFIELSRLPPDSLRDPKMRREVSARFDSHPV